TWTEKKGSNSFSYFYDIEITNSTIYLTTYSGVWTSTDGGVSWNEITTNHYEFGNANRIKRLPLSGRLVVLGSNGVHTSTNNGGSWVEQTSISGLNNKNLVNTS